MCELCVFVCFPGRLSRVTASVELFDLIGKGDDRNTCNILRHLSLYSLPSHGPKSLANKIRQTMYSTVLDIELVYGDQIQLAFDVAQFSRLCFSGAKISHHQSAVQLANAVPLSPTPIF